MGERHHLSALILRRRFGNHGHRNREIRTGREAEHGQADIEDGNAREKHEGQRGHNENAEGGEENTTTTQPVT